MLRRLTTRSRLRIRGRSRAKIERLIVPVWEDGLGDLAAPAVADLEQLTARASMRGPYESNRAIQWRTWPGGLLSWQPEVAGGVEATRAVIFG
jgi:hypothetical protein